MVSMDINALTLGLVKELKIVLGLVAYWIAFALGFKINALGDIMMSDFWGVGVKQKLTRR